MATSVAQLEPRSLERTTSRKRRGLPVAVVSALTLLAFATGGYHPYAEDGGLYLAGVKRLLDPGLYPHSTSFVLEPTRLSLFAAFVAGLVRLSGAGSERGLPIVLLVLHLAGIWVTLYAAWMLAARCWTAREARAGAVCLLACWLGLPVAGTALMFMDPYLTARSFSTPCMVLALAGALDLSGAGGYERGRIGRGFALWAGSLALAAAMHPLMAAYALGASLVLMAMRVRGRVMRILAVSGLCLLAIALAATLQGIAQPETAQYLGVAQTRTYWFLSHWQWYELAGLAAPLAILGFCALRRQGPIASLAKMSLAAGACAILIAALFARSQAPVHLVARIQPLRVFQTVYLVMILALGAWLGERVLRRGAWRWAAALALLASLMLAAQRAPYRNSRHLELPWTPPANPWVRAFLWIRNNTPKDALFALNPDYIHAPGEDAQCFRAIAERSALPDYSKDGGEASIAPELSPEWIAGQAAQRGLSTRSAESDDADRIAHLQPLGVTWIVLQASAPTRLECPYRNAAVEVCRLR